MHWRGFKEWDLVGGGVISFSMENISSFISLAPLITASTSPGQRPYGEEIILSY